MKLIYWPEEEYAPAETHEIDTLAGLWQFVHEHPAAEASDPYHQTLELSANVDLHDEPYLVLSWVWVSED